jgi:type VI secretion system protein ImpA
VRNALDKIIAYYSQNEPSSPVPILLVRAKKLVGADFVSIMKDMAPNGLENVRLVGGIESD